MSRGELLEWIAALGAVTDDALAVAAGCTRAAARARLHACEREGLLRRTRPLTDLPALHVLTPAGRRLLGGVTPAPPRITASNAAHAAWCARAAAVLGARHDGIHVEGEAALRAREIEAGRSIVSVPLRPGDRVHRPDLVLWPADGAAPIAIEVELTSKASRRLEEIVRAWARSRRVAGAVYYAPPAVATGVLRAVAGVGGGERVAVLPLAALWPPQNHPKRGVASSAPATTGRS